MSVLSHVRRASDDEGRIAVAGWTRTCGKASNRKIISVDMCFAPTMFNLLTDRIEIEEQDEVIDQFHGAYYMTK